MLYTNPLYGFFMTLFLFLMGRVQFLRQEVGSTIAMKDGQKFKIFRRVIIKRFNGTGTVSCEILESTQGNRTWRIIDTTPEEKSEFKLKYKLT